VELDQLHFSQPLWLLTGLAIPLMWLLYFLFFASSRPTKQLDAFIDAHLLPYLIAGKEKVKQSGWKGLLLWSFVWGTLTLALAGPRWNYRDIDVSYKDQSLVILLDLSESMNAKDVKPSRLIRAKQKILDLLEASKGVKVGLVAFAADPHMIVPITEDKATIRYLLPSIDTDLVYVQGSRLSAAMEMADAMLQAEPGINKAILIVSDGDFEDNGVVANIKSLADKGIVTHVLGVGTVEGAILQDKNGNNLKKNGTPVIAKLAKKRLEEMATLGQGSYLDSRLGNEEVILQQLAGRADSITAGQKKRIWEEQFHWFLLPALPIFIWWFRKGVIFALPLFLSFAMQLHGGIKEDYFMNREERGKAAMEEGLFNEAADFFEDPYKKGVACYKSGDYAKAEKLFGQSLRNEVAIDAEYNLGNALALQGKFKEAVAAYEKVLWEEPDHLKAKENLEIVKKLLQEQQQKKDNQDKQKPEDPKDEKEQQDQNEKQDQSDESENGEGAANSKQENDREKKDDLDQSEDGEDKEQEVQENNPEQATENNKENLQENSEEQNNENEQEAATQPENNDYNGQDENQEADFWLNRINQDPKNFLKNKFYI